MVFQNVLRKYYFIDNQLNKPKKAVSAHPLFLQSVYLLVNTNNKLQKKWIDVWIVPIGSGKCSLTANGLQIQTIKSNYWAWIGNKPRKKSETWIPLPNWPFMATIIWQGFYMLLKPASSTSGTNTVLTFRHCNPKPIGTHWSQTLYGMPKNL